MKKSNDNNTTKQTKDQNSNKKKTAHPTNGSTVPSIQVMSQVPPQSKPLSKEQVKLEIDRMLLSNSSLLISIKGRILGDKINKRKGWGKRKLGEVDVSGEGGLGGGGGCDVLQDEFNWNVGEIEQLLVTYFGGGCCGGGGGGEKLGSFDSEPSSSSSSSSYPINERTAKST